MPILPQQSSSIIDELKSRGFKPNAGETLPYYNFRQNLYDQSGLKSLLGDFKGSPEQNTQLLRQIREKNLTPQMFGQQPVVPIQQVAPDQGNATATNTLTAIGGNQPNRMPTSQELGIPEVRSSQDILAQIGQIQGTSPEQILGTAQGGLTAQIAQRQGQEAIATGEANAQVTAEQFGSRGLFFSGARVSAEGAKRAEALSKKMSIDESLAKFIIQQQEQGDKETASRIKEIVNDAVKGDEKARSEAITALGNLGYVVMPNGQIVQKPSEQRAIQDQAFQQENQIRAEARDVRAETSQQIQIANMERADRQFALSMARFESEQDKQRAIVSGNVNDYINGVIGLGDLEASQRPLVTGAIKGWLGQEQNTTEGINRKLEISGELKQTIKLSDEELRLQIMDDFAKGASEESVRNGINNAPISNKDSANKIIDEVYGKLETKTNSSGAVLNIGGNVGNENAFLKSGFKFEPNFGGIDFSNVRIPSLLRF